MTTIGIFDSGVGGLSVLREVRKALPGHDFIYFSDNANCPYGEKSPEFIRERCSRITDMLLGKGAKLIVVACNTATSAAIVHLRSTYPDIPFVGMEPAVKPAALGTQTGVIGVLATAGTLKGSKYLDNKSRFEDNVTIVESVGRGFVELVEAGETSGARAEKVCSESLLPLLENGADRIVLGCTHYPFLRDTLEKIASERYPGRDIQFIDPAPAVARRAVSLLGETNSEHSDGKVELLSSGDSSVLQRMFVGSQSLK